MRALQKVLMKDPKYIFSAMASQPAEAGLQFRDNSPRMACSSLKDPTVPQLCEMGMADSRHLGLPDRRAERRGPCEMCPARGGSRRGQHRRWQLDPIECGAAAPYQNFAHHQAPSPLEAQHSVLYGHRWAETFLGHLKEVDTFVEEAWQRKRSEQGDHRQQHTSGETEAQGQKQRGCRQGAKRAGHQAIPIVACADMSPLGEAEPSGDRIQVRPPEIHVPGSRALAFSGRGGLQALLRHLLKSRCCPGSLHLRKRR